MATHEWAEQCLKRREAGDKVTVVSDTGNRLQLGGQQLQQRFFFGLCPSCHKIGEHSACSGCLMVSYCSRECQKKDWKTHKSLCKILTKIRGSSKTHLFHNDPSAQPRVTQALELSLGRKLEQNEADILTHARICLVCHSADQAGLTNCPRCQCVAYCSESCRAEDEALHATVCSDLSHCITDYWWQLTKGQ